MIRIHKYLINILLWSVLIFSLCGCTKQYSLGHVVKGASRLDVVYKGRIYNAEVEASKGELVARKDNKETKIIVR